MNNKEELNNLKNATYILWQDYGCDGWVPICFNTLEEVIESEKYCINWIITEPTTYTIISKKLK